MTQDKILIKGTFKKAISVAVMLLVGGIIANILAIIALNAKGASKELGSLLQVLGLVAVAVSIFIFVLNLAQTKCELVVTDKRVYGYARFGKRADLPLDSISAIGRGMFRAITVATASGRISFMFLSNSDEVYKVLNDLLINRQNESKKASTTEVIMQSDSADQLKKYKDLLDSGVITQKEFDAKKNQLLGL